MTPTSRGGLGISRLNDLNTTFIVQWIFRFTIERDSLWRKVVCAKSEADPSRMLPVVTRCNRKYSSVNLIGSFHDMNDKVTLLVQEDFRMLIGDSFNNNFWSNDWVDIGILKDMLPRVFAQVANK